MFKLSKMDVTSTPPLEYLPTTTGTAYDAGDALVIAAGKAALCGATTSPLYIAAGTCTGAVGVSIPAIRVQKTMLFETPLTAVGTALNLGDKVTLSATADGVTATTASGVAELVDINGTAIGDTVVVRF